MPPRADRRRRNIILAVLPVLVALLTLPGGFHRAADFNPAFSRDAHSYENDLTVKSAQPHGSLAAPTPTFDRTDRTRSAELIGGSLSPSVLVVAAEAEAAAVGGAGPVAQGAAGVDRTTAEIEASGGRVLGREVTLDVNGVRTRPDLLAEVPNGQQAFIEVKTGPGAA